MQAGGAGGLVDVQDHQRRRQRHVTVVVAGEGVFGHADQGVAHRRERTVTEVGGDQAVVVMAQGAVHHRPPVGIQTGGEAPGAVLVEAHRHRLLLRPPLLLRFLGCVEVGVGAAHPGQLGDRHRRREPAGFGVGVGGSVAGDGGGLIDGELAPLQRPHRHRQLLDPFRDGRHRPRRPGPTAQPPAQPPGRGQVPTAAQAVQLADQHGQLAVQRVQVPGQLGDAFLDLPYPGLVLGPHSSDPTGHVPEHTERV